MSPTRSRLKPFGGILAGLVFAILLYAALDSLYQIPENAIPASAQAGLTLPGAPQEIPVFLPWYTSSTLDRSFPPGTYVFTFTIEVPPSVLETGSPHTLVFPYIGGSALQVEVNGVWIGSRGDIVGGRSNIWNSAKTLPVPSGLLTERTTVRMQITGIYEAGIIRLPYLVDSIKGATKMALLRFASDFAVWMLVGMIFIMGITITVLGLASLPEADPRVVLGIASIGAAILMNDFVSFEYLPIPLLAFKRLVVILRHGTGAAFLAACLRLLDRKPGWFAKLFIGLQVLCIILLLIPTSMIDLKRMYDWTYLTFLPFPIYLLVLILQEPRSSRGVHAVIIGSSVGLLAAIRDTLAAFLWPDAVLVSHYGFMFMILAWTAYIVTDMAETNWMLVQERRRAERYREESMRDPMTGVYNRKVLPLVEESVSGPLAVIVADIDEMKTINDTQGHLTGDRVIQDFAATLVRVFRSRDYIIRTGGDEFLIIIPGCTEESIEGLEHRLLGEVSQARLASGSPSRPEIHAGKTNTQARAFPGEKVISYSASLGSSYCPDWGRIGPERLRALIEEADGVLYRHKGRKAETRF